MPHPRQQRHNCFIGLGSNLADPCQQVTDAFTHLGQIRDTQLVARSSLYQTEPISDIEQEDYINAVAQLNTSLEPLQLLLELQAIEHAFYRDRHTEQRWGPRTLDLDILIYDSHRQQDSHLTLPHPRLQERRFVLLPLREIAGDLYLPGLGSLDYLIEQAPVQRIQRLEPWDAIN